MSSSNSAANVLKRRLASAQARAEQAELRTESAKNRIDVAEMRTEKAETRTDIAKTRTEIAETRAEQAETRAEHVEATLQRVVDRDRAFQNIVSAGSAKELPLKIISAGNNLLDQLTDRQRSILKLIAERKNTKQMAELFKLSPKTVEYHRLKLMNRLKIHDIAGLVRFALRAGLIPEEV